MQQIFPRFSANSVFPDRNSPFGRPASDPQLNWTPCGQPFSNVSSGSEILSINLITAHGIRRTPLIYSDRDTPPLTKVEISAHIDRRLDGGWSTVGCQNDVGLLPAYRRATGGLPPGKCRRRIPIGNATRHRHPRKSNPLCLRNAPSRPFPRHPSSAIRSAPSPGRHRTLCERWLPFSENAPTPAVIPIVIPGCGEVVVRSGRVVVVLRLSGSGR